MARSYQWYSRVGEGLNLERNDVVSLDLLQGAGSAGDTVIRTIAFVTVAGSLDISPSAPGVAQLGAQVADQAPVDPFGNPELQETEWIWLGHERLNASSASPESVRGVWTASWQPAFDSRGARVLSSGDSVWLSIQLAGVILSGTWQYRYTSRVLTLVAE